MQCSLALGNQINMMQELIWNGADMLKHAAFQIPEHQMSRWASLGSSACHRSRGQAAKTRLVTANLSLPLVFLEFKQSDKAYVDRKGHFHTQGFSIELNVGKNICKDGRYSSNYNKIKCKIKRIPSRAVVDSYSLNKVCQQFLHQRPCSRSHSQWEAGGIQKLSQ